MTHISCQNLGICFLNARSELPCTGVICIKKIAAEQHQRPQYKACLHCGFTVKEPKRRWTPGRELVPLSLLPEPSVMPSTMYVALRFFGWSFISAVQYSDFDFHVCFSSKIVYVSQGCGHHLHFLVGHPSVHYFQAQKCLPKMVKTTLAVVAESITGILISKTSFLRLNT